MSETQNDANPGNGEVPPVVDDRVELINLLRHQNDALVTDLENAANTIQELRNKNQALISELELATGQNSRVEAFKASQAAKQEPGPRTDGN